LRLPDDEARRRYWKILGRWEASAILTDVSGGWLNVTDGIERIR